MRREEDLDGSGVARARALQHLEQFDHAAAVPSGAPQDLQSHLVGIALVVAAEFQEHAVGDQPCGDLRRARSTGVPENRTEQPQPPVGHDRLRQLIGCMTPGNVRDLVGKDSGDLRFVAGELEHTAVDPHGSARKRERVDLAVISDDEGIGILRTRSRTR